MRQVLTQFQETDWLAWFNHANLYVLGASVLALVCLGHKLAIMHRAVYGWGLRLGALAFLVFGGWSAVHSGGISQLNSAQVARAAILGGAVLAVCWIFLPFVTFVYTYFRFGLAGLLAYGAYALATADVADEEAMLGIGIRAVAVAGLAMVFAWIFKPVWEVAISLLPTRKVKDTPPIEARPKPGLPTWGDLEAARQSPAVLEAIALPVEGEDRRRRDKARLAVEVTYLLIAPELAERLSRATLDLWMQRYLGDHLSPDEVEENSKLLLLAFRARRLDDANLFFDAEPGRPNNNGAIADVK